MSAAAVGTLPAVLNQQTGTTVAVTMPTHRAGDLILIFGVTRSTTAWTASGGFVLVHQDTVGNPSVGLLAKVAQTSAETCTVTIGNDDASFQAVRVAYHGVRAGFEATDIEKGTVATATSTTADPPSVTWSGSKDWLVFALAGAAFTATGDVFSAGITGWNNTLLSKSAATTTSVGIALGWLDDPASTSRNPATFTNTSRVWRAQTYGIPPSTRAPVVIDIWAGANGDAWPNDWTTSFLGGTGTIDVQTSKGRLLSANTGASLDAARALRRCENSDAIWYVENTFAASPANQQFVLQMRAAGNWNNTGHSSDADYAIVMTEADVQLYNDPTVQLAAPAFSTVLGNTYAIKVILLGTTIRCRVWDKAGAEPTTWVIDTTDATWASGNYVQVRNLNGTAAGAVDSRVDNLTFTNLLYPLRPPLVVSQAIRAATR